MPPLTPSSTTAAAAPFRPAARVVAVARKPVLTVCQAAATDAPAAAAVVEDGVKGGIAHLRFQRGSPFKVRRVLDTIRGASYEDALILMEYMPYRACEKILKALMSAAANAKHNSKAMKTKLFVAECFADGGPVYKRFQERAKGSAYRINKPTFHLTIRVEERQ